MGRKNILSNMVLSFRAREAAPSGGVIAEPLDRFAAFLLDIQAIALMTTALNAPLRLLAMEWGILQNETAATVASMLALSVFWVTAVMYETVATQFLGGTFGKILFSLQVVGLETMPTWHVTLRRSVLKWMSLVWLLPLLGILSDSRRRTLYDRAYDTLVVKRSRKSAEASASAAPTIREVRLAGGVAVSAWGVIFLLVGLFVYEASLIVGGARGPSKKQFSTVKLCGSKIGQVLEEGSFGIDEALMSYTLDIIDEKCLEEITSEVLVRAKDKGYLSEELTAKTYLARSFVHFKSPELSDQYLESICEVSSSSEACAVAGLISAQAESEDVELGAPVSEDLSVHLKNARGQSALGKLWALQFKMRHSDFQEALDILDELQSLRLASWLSAPFAQKRVQALNGMARFSEAEQVLLTAAPLVEPREYGVLARGLCLDRLTESCDSLESVSCRESLPLLEDRSVRGELPDVLRLRVSECSRTLGLPEVDGSEIESEVVLQIVQAQSQYLKGHRAEALDLLHDAYSRATTARLERELIQTALKWVRSSKELSAWAPLIREHRREPSIKLALIELKESIAPQSRQRLPASVESNDETSP